MARRINLVPTGERARTTTNVGVLGLVAAGIIVLFGLGLGYYLLSNTLSDRKQELEDIQAQRAALEAQVRALQAYEQLASQRAAAERIVQGIYAGRTLVSEVLDDVSQVIPSNVWFVDLSLTASDPDFSLVEQKGASVRSSDNVLSVEGNTYAFEDVARFLVRLELVPSLSNIDLVSAGEPIGPTDEAQEVKGFSIEAAVLNTQPADAPLPISSLIEVKWE